jgi:ATP-dependent Clp protease adaptor protein ClpS
MSDEDQGAAVAEPIVSTITEPKAKARPGTETRRQPPYNVIILNDEEHTFEYVIELLTKLFAHPLDKARVLTWQIHTAGRSVVYTTHKEKAELKRDQVLAYGADPRMSVSKGPLGCYIEPAPID